MTDREVRNLSFGKDQVINLAVIATINGTELQNQDTVDLAAASSATHVAHAASAATCSGVRIENAVGMDALAPHNE